MTDPIGGYRLGKRPAVVVKGLRMLDEYVDGRLPSPPPEVHPPALRGGAWGMFGNGNDPDLPPGQNPVGDCVIAEDCHEILTVNARLHMADIVPTTPIAVTEYFQETGGADTGLVIANHLAHWKRTPLYGPPEGGAPKAANQLAAFAPIGTGSILSLQRAIDWCGGAKIGVLLPESAFEQFGRGRPWTFTPGSPVAGGHCICLNGYGPEYVSGVTWAKEVRITYPWLEHACDEMWALILQAVKERGFGPTRIRLDQLEADIDTFAPAA